MSILGNVRRGVFSTIANNRNNPVIRAAHAAAKFVEDAYHNDGSDFALNGEKHALDKLARFPFQTIFDVGANEGHWSAYALSKWPNAHVHAFEIAPPTATIARNTLKRYLGERASVHEIGLSDADAELEMFYFPDNNQLTCNEPRHPKYKSESFKAKVTTLDAFCAAQAIGKIDYLKVDVEGHEHKVLQGALGLLQRNAIQCIQFEYGAFATSTRFLLKDFYALLAPTYHVGKIFPRGVIFRDYEWTMEDFRFGNFICVHRSQMPVIASLAIPS